MSPKAQAVLKKAAAMGVTIEYRGGGELYVEPRSRCSWDLLEAVQMNKDDLLRGFVVRDFLVGAGSKGGRATQAKRNQRERCEFARLGAKVRWQREAEKKAKAVGRTSESPRSSAKGLFAGPT